LLASTSVPIAEILERRELLSSSGTPPTLTWDSPDSNVEVAPATLNLGGQILEPFTWDITDRTQPLRQ
jgi:hypothetical protein